MHRWVTACVLAGLVFGFASVVHAQEIQSLDVSVFDDSPVFSSPLAGPVAGFLLYLFIASSLFQFAAAWVLCTKADRPGWAILLPIYNIIVLLQIAGKPWWWMLLYVVPVVGFIVTFLHMIALAEAFGKSALFGVGMVFFSFILIPVLAFGEAEYCGPEWSSA